MEEKINIEVCPEVTEQVDIGHLIKILGDRFKAWGDKEMKENNLTFTQAHTLMFLHGNGDTASQKDIEKFLRVSHPTVVGIINRLEKNGYVTTYQDENDRRNKIVAVTEKAIATRDGMGERRANLEKLISVGMSDDESKELRRLLTIVYENIEGAINDQNTCK